jgi:hypothetical protein
VSIRNPPRAFYWLLILLPPAMLVYIVRSGQLAELWGAFRGAPSPAQFKRAYLTVCLWMSASWPLFVTAWFIGRRQTGARPLQSAFMVGLREVFARALRHEAKRAR